MVFLVNSTMQEIGLPPMSRPTPFSILLSPVAAGEHEDMPVVVVALVGISLRHPPWQGQRRLLLPLERAERAEWTEPTLGDEACLEQIQFFQLHPSAAAAEAPLMKKAALR